jgi:hypothetical protein
MKLLLLVTLFTQLSFAGLLNAVAFTVDGEPITLYDIDRVKLQQKLSDEQAAVELLKQRITLNLAKEKNVAVDKANVTRYIDGIMKKNNMDRKAFEQNLQIENLSYDEYFQQVYVQQVQQQLIGMLTYGKITAPTMEEKKNFFEQHIDEFSMPISISVTEYTSPNQQSLVNKQRSPMFFPQDMTQNNKEMNPQTINPQLAKLLLSTKVNSYTQIFQASATTYMMFYIRAFGERATADFASVEKQLENSIMGKKKNTLINNIFQDEMRKANINYIKIKPLEI